MPNRPGAAYRTDLPPDEAEWERAATIPSKFHPSLSASDNETVERVLIYGPRGEALIREVPRPVGFRVR